MRKLIIGIFVFGLLGVAGVAIVGLMFLNKPPQKEASPMVYEVTPGPFKKIAADLYEKGLITSAFKFEWLARMTGDIKKVRTGEYEMNTAMVPLEILQVLTSGKSKLHTITFPEGINQFELAELIEKRQLGSANTILELISDRKFISELLGDSTIPSLEGYLFPETYAFTKYTGERIIVRTMVEKFMSVYSDVSRGRTLPRPLSRHEAVVLASMVEKETGAPSERPMIASVFYNRLNLKMKLQSDPTTMYGVMMETGKSVTNITKAHLLTPNKYNTYTVPALPFGPIANPGREALEAIYSPAQSEFLFFVSRNDGTHVFSKNFGDHNKAVTKFQLDQRARQGKSWRDLNKKK